MTKEQFEKANQLKIAIDEIEMFLYMVSERPTYYLMYVQEKADSTAKRPVFAPLEEMGSEISMLIKCAHADIVKAAREKLEMLYGAIEKL